MPDRLKNTKFRKTIFDCRGKQVGYDCMPDGQEELYDYLRANPHRFHLGRIGLGFNTAVTVDDVAEINQTLDMYTGILKSSFSIFGVPALVTTCCMDDRDAIAVKIKSDMIAEKDMYAMVQFPYASEKKTRQRITAMYRRMKRLVSNREKISSS